MKQLDAFALPVVGLSGKGGSGKDFCGQVMREALGYATFAFAHALKLDVMCRTGWSATDVFDRKPPAVRTTLQEYGVAQRVKHPDIWVNRAFKLVEMLELRPVVFTDVRFPNEADAIRAAGGRVLRINPVDRPPTITDPVQAAHISETALDDYAFDATIFNGTDQTPRSLREQIVRALA